MRAARLFALIVALLVLMTTAAAVALSQSMAESEARRVAETRVTGLARGLAAPFVGSADAIGESVEDSDLDRVLRGRLAAGGIEHMAIWRDDGTVVWSDKTAVLGRRFPLPSGAEEALGEAGAVVRLPGESGHHLDALYEADGEIEVYAAAYDADGEPFVLEAYLPRDTIGEARTAVMIPLLLLSVVPLLALAVLAVPIAQRLARSVDHARQLQVHAMDRSVASWRHQRRLLAEELHDGVIQDLAAVHYGLSVLTSQEPADPTEQEVRRRLRESIESAESSLRSLVFDLTPRRLSGDGLRAAAEELAERYRGHGLIVDLVIAPEVSAPEGTAILAFRTLREGLRNVVKHAEATHVWLTVASGEGDGVEVRIEDDGAHQVDRASLRAGQGLRLLADTVQEAGGSVTLLPRPGAGSVLRVLVPFVSAEPGRP